MKVLKPEAIPAESANSPLFTGGPVTRQTLLTPDMSNNFNLGIVNFSAGARNKMHIHSSDQVLFVTAGKRIIATEANQEVIGVGDVVHIPAEEKHWHADPAGDWPPTVMALDAEIKVVGPSGERWVKCDDFFLGLLMSVLEPDEVVTALKVPVTGNDKTAYLKAAPRSSGFAVVGVAVRLALDASGVCRRIALGITGVTDKAYRADRAEQMLIGKKLDSKLIEDAAAESTRNVDVIEDINGSSEYRAHLTHVYVARAIQTAMQS